MEVIKYLASDLAANKASFKSMLIVALFRLSSSFARSKYKAVRLLGIPVRIFYKALVEFVMGVELPDKVQAGRALRIYHGTGLVVNAGTVIGDNVELRHNTTIGSKTNGGKAPVIGNNVSVGAHSLILGGISVGDNTVIAAGAILVEDCPPNSIVIGQKSSIKQVIKHD